MIKAVGNIFYCMCLDANFDLDSDRIVPLRTRLNVDFEATDGGCRHQLQPGAAQWSHGHLPDAARACTAPDNSETLSDSDVPSCKYFDETTPYSELRYSVARLTSRQSFSRADSASAGRHRVTPTGGMLCWLLVIASWTLRSLSRQIVRRTRVRMQQARTSTART